MQPSFLKFPARLARHLLIGIAMVATCIAHAEDPWPNRPVTVINPWAAGGPSDTIIRPITDQLAKRLGQAFIVDNRSGANGTIGAAAVARARPDGYTLLFSHVGPIAISPALPQKLPYDPIQDFEPITQLVSSGTVLVVRSDFPAKTLAQLMAYAKANPGKVAYGSVGVGSTTHLAGVMLSQLGHVEMTHVPYRGSAQINTDLLAGQIQMAFVNIAGVVPLIKDGQLRALAVSTLKRTAVLPDVPAVAETMPGFEVNSWYGLMAPAHTPPAIIHKLQSETAQILKMPEVAARMRENGLDIEGTTPEAYGQKIKEDIARWAATVKAAGIKE
ncbi:Argininosuccinate lyase (plasmid) [Variovorax sp. SRS16]|uniref:Bug family tripartite tricarboxylate transporter substrate binding protein n=1 Tax=Variovorax sp. SRS16 TaxID=282217 RepID=UPI001317192F|nr:tripartite tricarboxylate transporter substrate binding protein [Variovorax sp. SRS16]VTU46608.1 Argininosuccinate lyase [Variovorax sp. SRS16]